MRRDVQARIRRRIVDRLGELRMTQRELARAIGHDDAWISGILSGSQGMHWKDFDAVATKLNLSPSELVRHDDATVRELAPREMQLLRHFQSWPDSIKDHWLEVLSFFTASVPDAESALLLSHLRRTPRSLRTPVMRWLGHLLEEGLPPTFLADVVAQYSDEAPDGTTTTSLFPRALAGFGNHVPGADPKNQKGRRTRKREGRAKGAKRQTDGST